MSTTCWCGNSKTRFACTNCGQGLCHDHMAGHGRPRINQGKSKGFGRGKTLEDAAFDMGYWQDWDRFICHDCRNKEGERVRIAMVRRACSWPNDPFGFAITAAFCGLAFDSMSLPVETALEYWSRVKIPPGRVTAEYKIREAIPPRKLLWSNRYTEYQPPRYAPFEIDGWEFLCTVRKWVEIPSGYNETNSTQRYAGTTVMLANGDVYYDGVRHDQPPTEVGELHLLVAMAHNIADYKGREWNGVPYGVL